MVDNVEKLKVMLKHLEGHNEEHAQEIQGLAQKAKEFGNIEAYDFMLKSVEELRLSNASLEKALEAISKEV